MNEWWADDTGAEYVLVPSFDVSEQKRCLFHFVRLDEPCRIRKIDESTKEESDTSEALRFRSRNILFPQWTICFWFILSLLIFITIFNNIRSTYNFVRLRRCICYTRDGMCYILDVLQVSQKREYRCAKENFTKIRENDRDSFINEFVRILGSWKKKLCAV